jgi:intracellular multiplication protein IcmJ
VPVAIDVPIAIDNVDPRIFSEIGPELVHVVHQRDHFTCRGCGFASLKFQQVMVRGGNWRDIANITTACIFCQQCVSLDSVPRMRSGILIEFPELPQAELNRLLWEIYAARVGLNNAAAVASLDFLMTRRERVRANLGTDDPFLLAERMRGLRTDREWSALRAQLKDVRLLGLDRRVQVEYGTEYNEFPQILAYVRSVDGPYHSDRRPFAPLLDRFAEGYLKRLAR